MRSSPTRRNVLPRRFDGAADARPSPRQPGDAVLVGLGAMLGGGVFSAFGPAAAAAGRGLLLGLALASVVRLLQRHILGRPLALFTRRPAGPTPTAATGAAVSCWGFLAGWGAWWGSPRRARRWRSPSRLRGTRAKLARAPRRGPCRAGGHRVNLRGMARTAGLTRILVAVSLAALAVVVGAILGSSRARLGNLSLELPGGPRGDPVGGVALLRLRRLREDRDSRKEVRDPERTIRVAIPWPSASPWRCTPSCRRLRAPGSRLGRPGLELETAR